MLSSERTDIAGLDETEDLTPASQKLNIPVTSPIAGYEDPSINSAETINTATSTEIQSFLFDLGNTLNLNEFIESSLVAYHPIRCQSPSIKLGTSNFCFFDMTYIVSAFNEKTRNYSYSLTQVL